MLIINNIKIIEYSLFYYTLIIIDNNRMEIIKLTLGLNTIDVYFEFLPYSRINRNISFILSYIKKTIFNPKF